MTKRWYFWCPKCGLAEGWSYNEQTDDDIPEEPDWGCDCEWHKITWAILMLFVPDLPKHPLPGEHYVFDQIHIPFSPEIAEALYCIEADHLDIQLEY